MVTLSVGTTLREQSILFVNQTLLVYNIQAGSTDNIEMKLNLLPFVSIFC